MDNQSIAVAISVGSGIAVSILGLSATVAVAFLTAIYECEALLTTSRTWLEQCLLLKMASRSSPARRAQAPRNKPSVESTSTLQRSKIDMAEPSLDPYIGKLERFELFSTNQCYYLVACDKNHTAYRVLKMDRTLIERPPQAAEFPSQHSDAASVNSETPVETSHKAKPTLRRLSAFLTEDPHIYTQDEIQDMLDMIHHGNRLLRADGGESSSGGLKEVVKAYGVVGFIRFLDCYYLTVITHRAKVGSIGGNSIYTIKATETFPLKPAERMELSSGGTDQHTDPSSMLLSMWNRGKRSVGLGLTNREIAELRYQGLYQVVDLTKNFYFSYTYDITRSLQENFLANTTQPFPPPPIKDMYAWNFFLSREIDECTNTSYHWVMPIIHGAFVQRKLNDYGRSLNLILIARRSRHFAGTRYLKRGVSEQGKVANDVEHEQILHDESSLNASGAYSSYLQNRGSIPTYWTQESSVTMPKPPIELNRVDPTYRATQAHFEDLLKRYGSPIIVLDLVKQSEKREREVRVGNEFRHAIDMINTSIDDTHKIRYCALDYSHISKHRNLDVSTSLNEVSTWAVNQTGFFCSSPRWKIIEGGHVEPFDEKDKLGAEFLTKELGVPMFPMEQKGVLRTNCIDCLDRTNVAQFSAGVEALEQQLVVMGIRSSAKLDPSSNIIRVLIEMYVEIGDHIALQYGGSEAHKKVSAEHASDSSFHGPMGKHKELLTSIRRYYSNAFTDRLKQDAMNLFLGYYIPYRHTIPLWEMETDYYLHNLHVRAGRGTLHSMKTYRRAFGVEWNEENDEANGDMELITSPLQRPKKRIGPAAPRDSTSTTDLYNPESEPWRITRVRNRCKAQTEALSVWWKAAIQANIQQRMWMQLGRSTSESMLPPRFERLYQPDKLVHFDRVFAQTWATPVRSSHSAQHSTPTDEDSEILEYRRNISGRGSSSAHLVHRYTTEAASSPAPESNQVFEDEMTIQGFVSTCGLKPRVNPTLTRFIKPHDIAHGLAVGGQDVMKADRYFVGRLGPEESPCNEYFQYVDSSPGKPFRRGAFEEFRNCLHDTSLSSDDVGGIRRLAESAHIGHTIRSGPYSGLKEIKSAVEVATVIHEQFNVLDSMRARGDLRGGLPLVDSELKRRESYSEGVRESVAVGWKRYISAEQQYAEVVDNSRAQCRRSDITTEKSLKLYSSFFDDSTRMSQLEMTYMLGEKPKLGDAATLGAVRRKSGKQSSDDTDGVPRESFADKAARVGISIPSSSEIERWKSPPLFFFERKGDVPAGFEQINEDLFARKDNKFMVLNGAGVDSWDGTQPKTKVYGIEDWDFVI